MGGQRHFPASPSLPAPSILPSFIQKSQWLLPGVQALAARLLGVVLQTSPEEARVPPRLCILTQASCPPQYQETSGICRLCALGVSASHVLTILQMRTLRLYSRAPCEMEQQQTRWASAVLLARGLSTGAPAPVGSRVLEHGRRRGGWKWTLTSPRPYGVEHSGPVCLKSSQWKEEKRVFVSAGEGLIPRQLKFKVLVPVSFNQHLQADPC